MQACAQISLLFCFYGNTFNDMSCVGGTFNDMSCVGGTCFVTVDEPVTFDKEKKFLI
jgi:hypothetical protein